MRRTTALSDSALNGVDNALSIASLATDTGTVMQPYLWLADTNGEVVYKVDTTLNGTDAIVGAYASRPSAVYGNPAAFAVLQNGDAFVSPSLLLRCHLRLLTALIRLSCAPAARPAIFTCTALECQFAC